MPPRYTKRKRTTTTATTTKADKKRRVPAPRPIFRAKPDTSTETPALDNKTDVNVPEFQGPDDEEPPYSPSSLGGNEYHGDYEARAYVPTSPVSQVSSFTGSEKEREQEIIRKFYAELQAEDDAGQREAEALAPEQSTKQKYNDDDVDDFDEKDELRDKVAITGTARPPPPWHTRRLEAHSLKDALENMAVVINFLKEVNKNAAIEADNPQSIKDAINYNDLRWTNKNIDWEVPIEQAYTYYNETVKLLYKIPVLAFMDLTYALLDFSSYLYSRGIEIV
ncbi:hypothetical protein M434DRAFT_379522 [Hypoxylon sp. CO27-5]|nr:hypothetical protein M434DRAFT_379522 [Hypoxylon sp. CO27-5]